MKNLSLIIHNIRSAHNVGSLLRTAEGLGISKVYISGYSPYPMKPNDERLPHIASRIHQRIQKTALGAESYVDWEQWDDIQILLQFLGANGVAIAALEQSNRSVPLHKFTSEDPLALLVGSEVTGVDPQLLNQCNVILEIPMFGKKESFNVAQAAAIAMYQLRLDK